MGKIDFFILGGGESAFIYEVNSKLKTLKHVVSFRLMGEHVTFVADTLKGAATHTKAAFAAWVYICKTDMLPSHGA